MSQPYTPKLNEIIVLLQCDTDHSILHQNIIYRFKDSKHSQDLQLVSCFFSLTAEPRTQSLSSDTPGAKNIHAGPEDSGVEVGQESEQESAPGMVVQSMSNASNLLDEQKMLGQMNRTNVGHTEFGEKSISEEHDIEKRTARPSR